MWSGVPTVTASIVAGFLVEHLAEIFVSARLGKGLKRAGGALVVNVAEGDDVGAQARDGGDVAASHAAGADAGDVHSLARRDEARAAQDVAGDDHEAQSRAAGCGQERSARFAERRQLRLEVGP